MPYADIELIITSSYHRIIVKTQADLGLSSGSVAPLRKVTKLCNFKFSQVKVMIIIKMPILLYVCED